jgi:DNA-binding transcriptional ArsR family regulator
MFSRPYPTLPGGRSSAWWPQSLNLNSIAGNFGMSRPAISQHIKILTECGLVVIKKQGRERYCEARLQQLSQVSDWVEQYRQLWATRFDSMDDILEELKAKSKKQGGRNTPGR